MKSFHLLIRRNIEKLYIFIKCWWTSRYKKSINYSHPHIIKRHYEKGLRNNVLITDTLDRLLYINMINEFPTRLSWDDFLLNVTVLKLHIRHKLRWKYILLCFENNLIATMDICCLFPFRAMSDNIYVQYTRTHIY